MTPGKNIFCKVKLLNFGTILKRTAAKFLADACQSRITIFCMDPIREVLSFLKMTPGAAAATAAAADGGGILEMPHPHPTSRPQEKISP